MSKGGILLAAIILSEQNFIGCVYLLEVWGPSWVKIFCVSCIVRRS